MFKKDTNLVTDRKILTIAIILLFLNSILLVTGIYLFLRQYSPIEEDFTTKQKLAKELVDYNRRLARTLGVDTRSQVQLALSRFNYEIDIAATSDDLNKAVLLHGSRTQERILEEYEIKQRETVLAIVNKDPNISRIYERIRLTINLSNETGVKAEPYNLLHEDTMQKIAETIMPGALAKELVVEIEVEEGRAVMLIPTNPQEMIRTLNRELDSLRVSLHELRSRSGFAELNGSGIIVRIYDADEGYTSESIIHDTDVRDMVNEIFAAGARGVAVGNQRLTATSAIRCVGPSILVNDERIAVNPVQIMAIGDPDVLASGLDIIRITLELSRNLRVEIEKADNLTLPAFAR